MEVTINVLIRRKRLLADFEDSNSLTGTTTSMARSTCADAIRRTIDYTSPEGKKYKLNDKVATLLIRPRGWHLNERHALIDGKPVSGSLFDFGLFFYNNHDALKRSLRPILLSA